MTVAHMSDGFYRTECGIFMGFDWSKRPDVYVHVIGRMPKWARRCRSCLKLSTLDKQGAQ